MRILINVYSVLQAILYNKANVKLVVRRDFIIILLCNVNHNALKDIILQTKNASHAIKIVSHAKGVNLINASNVIKKGVIKTTIQSIIYVIVKKVRFKYLMVNVPPIYKNNKIKLLELV